MRRHGIYLKLVGHVDLEQLVAIGKCGKVGDVQVREDLQQGARGMLGAVDDRMSCRMPARGGAQTSCADEIAMVADTPDLHDKNRLRRA